MSFFGWLREILDQRRERKIEQRRKREEDSRSHWNYTRKKLEEAIRAAEHYVAEEPLEPYPEKGSSDHNALARMYREGHKPSSYLFQYEKYDPVLMMGKAPTDIMKLRRRLQVLWNKIRWRELWNDLCRREFWDKHH